MTLPEQPIWAQTPNETTSQYHAFSHYRDLGPLRSIQKAYDLHRSDCISERQTSSIRAAKADIPRRWFTWSSDNQWVARVQAFDSYRDADKLQTLMTRMDAAKEFQFTLGRDLLNFAAKVLAGMDPEHFPRHLLRGLIDVGMRTMDASFEIPERAFGGPTTDPVETPEPQEEWTDVQVDEALEYAASVGLIIDLEGSPTVDPQDGDPADIQSEPTA